MSRSISIWYEPAGGGEQVTLEVRAPYFLLGTQRTSMAFWSLPRLKEVGIERLTELGDSDPVWFGDWDDLAELGRELELLQTHLPSLDFSTELKTAYLTHLLYCRLLLMQTAPPDSRPNFMIG